MTDEDANFAAAAVSSLSSVVSISSAGSKGKRNGSSGGGSILGSSLQRTSRLIDDDGMSTGSAAAAAREPLLQDSMRMKHTNHLVTDEYGSVGEVDSTVQHTLSSASENTQFGSEFYSSREYNVPPGLGGIQFHLDPDSTTVSGEYVNIMEDDGERPTSPTTLALQKCKRTVVKPYLTLLSLLGWFPIIPDNGTRKVVKAINTLYPLLAVCLILFAYVVQFAACFRRDAVLLANGTIECYSNAIGSYLIPDVLHSAAYIYAFYLFRYQQSENLVTLMERVFLQSSVGQSGYMSQDRLITRLRYMLRFNILWVVLSLLSQVIHVVGIATDHDIDNVIISFTWMNVRTSAGQVSLIVLMLIGFIALDIVYAAIVINYATHCELLIIMMRSMSTRALQKVASLQEVMREIMTAQKYLKYINESVATAVSLLMFNFGAAIVIGVQSAVSQNNSRDSDLVNDTLFSATIISLILWLIMFMIPLVQAARLSTACWSLGKIGQEVATRPFGFQNTGQDELNTFLMFTTSLQLRAKLFRIPIRSAHLLIVLVAGGFALMVLLTVSPQLFHLKF
eukprot:scpid37085/ scgid2863/ 